MNEVSAREKSQTEASVAERIDAFKAALTRFISDPLNRRFPGEIMSFISTTEWLLASRGEIDRKPSSYLKGHDKDILGFIKTAIRWWPANPNKKVAVERIISTYYVQEFDAADPVRRFGNAPIEWRAVDKLDYQYFGNSIEFLENKMIPIFELDRILDGDGSIFLIGSRGAGKTAFLNFWLTVRHPDFEKSNRTWFRIDVAKVHKIWRQSLSSAPSARISIVEIYKLYFRIHSAFVVLCYGGKAFPPKYNPDIGDGKSLVLENVYKHIERSDHDCLRMLTEMFSEEMHSFLLLGGSHLRRDMSEFIIRNVLLDPVRRDRFKNVLAQFMNLLESAIGTTKTKCIVIFDGLDNINWSKSNEFYSESCLNIGMVCENCDGDLGGSSKILFVTRSETFSEIPMDGDRIVGYNNGVNTFFHDVRLGEPNIIHVIEKKLHAALKCASIISLRRHQDGKLFNPQLSAETDRYISRQQNLIKRYAEIIEGNIIESVGAGSIDRIRNNTRAASGSILGMLYNGDIRAMLDSFVKANALDSFYITNFGRGAQSRRRILQYVFLNGRPFYSTKFGQNIDEGRYQKDRGLVFPNLFAYDTRRSKDNPTAWHGLVMVRIIQMAKDSVFLVGEMMYVLENVFGYSREVIVETVLTMVAFSLIYVEHSVVAMQDNRLGAMPDVYRKFRNSAFVTAKGKLILEIVKARPDVLYFYALDTPLLSAVVGGDSRFVRLSRDYDSIAFIENFYTASSATLAVFLNHLYGRDRLERTRIKERFCNPEFRAFLHALYGFRISYKEFASSIQLPDAYRQNFDRWVEKAYNSTDERIAGALRDDLDGIASLLAYKVR